MITIQKYVRAASLEEAYQLNENKRNRIIGGMMWLRTGSGSVNTVIDLCDLGLDTIQENEEFFSIGAMVTLRQLEMHASLNQYACGAVADALKDIVGVQFRNMATIGGSLWGRYGFSDVLTVFLSMDCEVELYHAGRVSLETFAGMEHDRDLIVRLIIRKTPGRFVYSAMRNQRTDFPVLTCAVSQIGGEYRAVIGARPARAMVIRDENGLLTGEIEAPAIAAFADYVADHAPMDSNVRAGAQYRTHLARVMTQRSLERLEGEQ